MMHRDRKHVILGAYPEQPNPKQRTSRQIKRHRHLFLDLATDLSLSIPRLRRHVRHQELDLRTLPDHLNRLPVPYRKRRPKRLVTRHQLRDAPTQRCLVQTTHQPICPRHVVRHATSIQLLDKPQPTLGKRRGNR